jgi:hypothetical protein
MPFQPGNKLSKGRPAGGLNRSTEQAKLAIARLANQGLDAIREDMERIRKQNPAKAAEIYLRLLEYIVPKKAQIDMKAQIDQNIKQISVNISDGTKHQHIKDI